MGFTAEQVAITGSLYMEKKRPGRPKEMETATRLTINCPGDLANKIKAQADSNGTSISQEIVYAIERYLKGK